MLINYYVVRRNVMTFMLINYQGAADILIVIYKTHGGGAASPGSE